MRQDGESSIVHTICVVNVITCAVAYEKRQARFRAALPRNRTCCTHGGGEGSTPTTPSRGSRNGWYIAKIHTVFAEAK